MKTIYLAFLLVFLGLNIRAQKNPDIQITPLNAPINIKVDGKANEWGENFAANNKRTSLLYTIANDDKNLYVVIKGVGAYNINKIMLGGITFSVNLNGKKKEKESLSVTYPIVKRAARGQGGGRQGRVGGQGRGGNVGDATGQNRTQLTTVQRDSVSLVGHKTQLATVKEIKVLGFKNITDSLISIYNEFGIKSVASFDDKGSMIYELAIPLSLLDLSTSNPKEFAYQIKVNGLVMNAFGGAGAAAGGGRGGARGGGFGGQGGGAESMQDLMSPTDFWGKYLLIKK